MDVSIVLNFYPRRPVGGMKVIHEYANYLAGHGHNVTLYYEYSENDIAAKYYLPIWAKLKLMEYRIELKPMSWFPLNKRIKRVAIKKINDSEIKNADIVIATAVETAMSVVKLSDLKGKKVYIIQDFENWYVSDSDVYKTYSQGMTNIVVAKWLKRIVDTYSKTPAIMISNSINTDIFNVGNPIENRRNHTIAFHYRKAAHKGCQYAIETLKLLQRLYSDLHVYVISIDDKPEGLPDSCEYFKNITPQKVADINNKSQVFMCSSIVEGFGLPGLEAMACGCALVSTEYKGVLEYAVNGENALLSPIRDAQSMANNVIKLFDDTVLREKLVQKGLHTAQERSLDKTGAKFEKILTKLIGEN